MMLEENMIGPDEAVQGLEALRFAWRGDEFELNLLHRLGNLYIVRGDYNNGLTTYRETISVFPDSAKVREIAQTMNDTFSALFLDGKADELPPITALAIYNDFRELTPVGNLGDQLIFRLSDRLVGVDLLEQAAELLQHQVEFRLRGGDLARVGARLAGIYMLDQKPERAVSALRASDVVRMPEPLSQQRHYLLTRALAESGDVDKALGLLRGDQSREANLLRADIYWKTQDWLEEATVIERLFHDRDPDAPLDAMEGQYLIRMSIALALSNNRQALAELRERFCPMMRETVNADAFFVLASYVDSGPIDPSDLASTVNEIGSYEAFMVSLREQVASETLSAVN
jgi:tetratricopeptide (TPR) repeat protein